MKPTLVWRLLIATAVLWQLFSVDDRHAGLFFTDIYIQQVVSVDFISQSRLGVGCLACDLH